jgi:hypothetical protein
VAWFDLASWDSRYNQANKGTQLNFASTSVTVESNVSYNGDGGESAGDGGGASGGGPVVVVTGGNDGVLFWGSQYGNAMTRRRKRR